MGPLLPKLVICVLALAATASGAAWSLSKTDHSTWSALLREFVNDQSRVDYLRLKNEALPRLDAYLAELARPGSSPLSASEQTAFLINAYNALTVRWVLQNYPVDSIWATPDPFKAARHTIGGRKISLDEIEKTLRQTGDARIHAALVCGARSCPPLRREAYVGERLDEQLDDNTRRWLADTTLNHFDSAKLEAQLSPIFKWYHGDFPNGVEGFVKQYAPEEMRKAAGDRKLRISYLEYNWGLNDQSDAGEGYSWFRLGMDWLRNLFR